ncbi:hypothetical protein CR513_61817, partial [Mucuna pruriens]
MKDPYPLPCIDRLIDHASGYAFLSFMDVYFGYNQIQMHPKDEEKITFITNNENFCYKVMSFGLKNRPNWPEMEMYVNYMVVKSPDESITARPLPVYSPPSRSTSKG